MDLVDEQLRGLEKTNPPLTKRPDHGAFWEATMKLVASVPLLVRREPVEYPLTGLSVSEVTYDGLDGTPVKGWFILPNPVPTGRLPAVVRYHGHGWHRGFPSHHAAWAAMGFAVLAVDTRLQGNDTGTKSGAAFGNCDAGVTLGLLDRDTYYLRHTFTDACRAVGVAREMPEIDPGKVVVEGGSQGGGLSIAVAALVPDVSLCLADVPSYGWMEKRVFGRTGTYSAVAGVLRRHPDWMEKACATLSYFDTMNLADRIRCPVLVSMGLKDPVVPPETVYAMYNRIRSEKRMEAYPFGEHDGGGGFHDELKYAFVKEKLGKAS